MREADPLGLEELVELGHYIPDGGPLFDHAHSSSLELKRQPQVLGQVGRAYGQG
jgi:hypothetical protein